jgi:shikimate kinase
VNRPRPQHVVLVGPMGAGKTTTGGALAEVLGWPLRDCDVDLEARAGRTATEIARSEGVAHLHRLEAEVLLDALDADEPSVITAAASVVEDETVRGALATPLVVWLDVPDAELLARMGAAAHRRPLDTTELAAVMGRRRPLLARLARVQLDGRRPTADLVGDLVAVLKDVERR